MKKTLPEKWHEGTLTRKDVKRWLKRNGNVDRDCGEADAKLFSLKEKFYPQIRGVGGEKL